MKQTLIGGRYRLHNPLGSGGMAEVFLAHDEVLERDVALKILKKQYAENERFVKLFRREAKSAASLNHPNIVIVYDWGRSENETYYMAMEYAPHGTLKDRIRTEGSLDPDKAIEVAYWVAQALGFAHERGMIHRDVKSQNILVTEADTAKVADFGIARATAATTTSRSTPILGTAGYMSPEQARGRPGGSWSDLYSLGVVLYEMLTGELPYRAEDQVALALKHVNEPPRSPKEANPEVPEVLDALTLRLLAKNPSERYESAAELLEDLRRARDGLPLASAHSESLTAKRTILPASPALVGSGRNSLLGAQYVVYKGRFRRIPLALATTLVVLLALLGGVVWGPWWGPQEELARAQDVAGGPLDGLGEASGANELAASAKEDEGENGLKEGSEMSNLPENEGQSSSEASAGSPKLADPSPVFTTDVLQGSTMGQYPKPESEANTLPVSGPEQLRGPEIRDRSMQEASQELFSGIHVGEGAAKQGSSSEPAKPGMGADAAVTPSAEGETSGAIESGSRPTSQDDGEEGEALKVKRPLDYEAIADPEVPPYIRFEQAKKRVEALAKGDPDAVRLGKQFLKDKLLDVSLG